MEQKFTSDYLQRKGVLAFSVVKKTVQVYTDKATQTTNKFPEMLLIKRL